jgi:hypothetical protein
MTMMFNQDLLVPRCRQEHRVGLLEATVRVATDYKIGDHVEVDIGIVWKIQGQEWVPAIITDDQRTVPSRDVHPSAAP